MQPGRSQSRHRSRNIIDSTARDTKGSRVATRYGTRASRLSSTPGEYNRAHRTGHRGGRENFSAKAHASRRTSTRNSTYQRTDSANGLDSRATPSTVLPTISMERCVALPPTIRPRHTSPRQAAYSSWSPSSVAKMELPVGLIAIMKQAHFC